MCLLYVKNAPQALFLLPGKVGFQSKSTHNSGIYVAVHVKKFNLLLLYSEIIYEHGCGSR